MASSTDAGGDRDAVEFVQEDDGSVTARHRETGLARGGETRAEALSQLAEVLDLHDGGGEPIEDPERFLRDELDLEPAETEDDLPDFLR